MRSIGFGTESGDCNRLRSLLIVSDKMVVPCSLGSSAFYVDIFTDKSLFWLTRRFRPAWLKCWSVVVIIGLMVLVRTVFVTRIDPSCRYSAEFKFPLLSSCLWSCRGEIGRVSRPSPKFIPMLLSSLRIVESDSFERIPDEATCACEARLDRKSIDFRFSIERGCWEILLPTTSNMVWVWLRGSSRWIGLTEKWSVCCKLGTVVLSEVKCILLCFSSFYSSRCKFRLTNYLKFKSVGHWSMTLALSNGLSAGLWSRRVANALDSRIRCISSRLTLLEVVCCR